MPLENDEYLPRKLYLRVRELLADASPYAAIAAETGLSEATVAAIANGSRQPSRIAVDDDHPLRDEMLSARRCPGCGALVFRWPCLACQIAASSTRSPKPQTSARRLPRPRTRRTHTRRRAA